MSSQVTRNKLASHWILSQRESWVEPYLIANNNARVRNGKFIIGKSENLTKCAMLSTRIENHE